MTAAHEVHETIHLVFYFPEHEARQNDPHYHWFNEARERLKKAGKLVCWIDNEDCRGGMQLHHSLIEFALINDVDIDKFKHLYPEFHMESDEDFYRVVESEGALTVLCQEHHLGARGIHIQPYPGWIVQRVLKAHIQAPVQKESK